MIIRINKNSKGAILILALWTMSFLAIFAAYVGLRVRQRVSLLSRIEARSQLRFLAESGTRKAIAMIKKEMKNSDGKLTASGKEFLFNNSKDFSSVKVGEGEFSVYTEIKENLRVVKIYGITDEERKINLNHADVAVIKKIIQLATNLKDDQAEDLAEALINWRELHATEITGFTSDNYYSNLKSPYEPKKAEFELFDELRLVKGMSAEIFNQLIPYITIYGDGVVNINTAPKEVLLALGLDSGVVEKILIARRGADHEEATADDYIFQKTFDIVSELRNFVDILPFEGEQIDKLNQGVKIKVSSVFYKIESRGIYRRENEELKVSCIYNQTEHWVEYWHEKY